MALVKYTETELSRLPSSTDWERLRKMTDEEIDYSDIPPTDDVWFERALNKRHERLVSEAAAKIPVTFTVFLSPDSLTAFRRKHKSWKSFLHRNVETYINQQVLLH